MNKLEHVVSPAEFRSIIWNGLLTKTATQIAEMCGVSPASVRRWVDGTNCPMPSIRGMIKEKLSV